MTQSSTCPGRGEPGCPSHRGYPRQQVPDRSAVTRRPASRRGRGSSAMKRGQGASAPPPSPLSWRAPIRPQPSRLTGARGASICRLVSFSPSVAARPSRRAGAHSSNPMRHSLRPSRHATASAGAAHSHLGNGDGLREGARESDTLSAVATLAYDCRRSAYFTDQLYAALTLIDRGIPRQARAAPCTVRSAKHSSYPRPSSSMAPAEVSTPRPARCPPRQISSEPMAGARVRGTSPVKPILELSKHGMLLRSISGLSRLLASRLTGTKGDEHRPELLSACASPRPEPHPAPAQPFALAEPRHALPLPSRRPGHACHLIASIATAPIPRRPVIVTGPIIGPSIISPAIGPPGHATGYAPGMP